MNPPTPLLVRQCKHLQSYFKPQNSRREWPTARRHAKQFCAVSSGDSMTPNLYMTITFSGSADLDAVARACVRACVRAAIISA